jgi:hypothetical protein
MEFVGGDRLMVGDGSGKDEWNESQKQKSTQ